VEVAVKVKWWSEGVANDLGAPPNQTGDLAEFEDVATSFGVIFRG
jgi:hypothetical protein